MEIKKPPTSSASITFQIGDFTGTGEVILPSISS